MWEYPWTLHYRLWWHSNHMTIECTLRHLFFKERISVAILWTVIEAFLLSYHVRMNMYIFSCILYQIDFSFQKTRLNIYLSCVKIYIKYSRYKFDIPRYEIVIKFILMLWIPLSYWAKFSGKTFKVWFTWIIWPRYQIVYMIWYIWYGSLNRRDNFYSFRIYMMTA